DRVNRLPEQTQRRVYGCATSARRRGSGMEEKIPLAATHSRAERKRLSRQSHTHIEETWKELGIGIRLHKGNTQTWLKWLEWQTGQERYRHSQGVSAQRDLMVFFLPLM
ncbi:hypothetical protein K469DRAFT_699894, partial [Zopfia rhizophila CBS 207.26]